MVEYFPMFRLTGREVGTTAGCALISQFPESAAAELAFQMSAANGSRLELDRGSCVVALILVSAVGPVAADSLGREL